MKKKRTAAVAVQNGKQSKQKREEELIDEIAVGITKLQGQAYSIGKCVHEYVQIKGNTYGCATIEELSRHPKIQCCSRQLRRCWAYYRLHKLYGKAIEAHAKKLPKSYWYELARLIDLDISEPEIKGLVLKYAALFRTRREEKRTVTVDEFRTMISTTIEETKENKGKKPTTTPTPSSSLSMTPSSSPSPTPMEDETKGKGNEPTTKPTPTPKSSSSPSSSPSPSPQQEGAEQKQKQKDVKPVEDWAAQLKQIADDFQAFADPAHLQKAKLSIADVRCQMTRIQDSLFNLYDCLLAKGDGDNLAPMVHALAAKANERIRELPAETEGNSDSLSKCRVA